MPFAKKYRPIYAAMVEALAELGLIPVRTDHLDQVGNVVDFIREGIASCECALAVITDQNPNVMYELGFAHALDKPTLILCEREGRRPPKLPFDLKTYDVAAYSSANLDELRHVIKRKLAQVVPADPDGGRASPQAGTQR
jgi:nucleoside 2-deoxyribosyltransferase